MPHVRSGTQPRRLPQAAGAEAGGFARVERVMQVDDWVLWVLAGFAVVVTLFGIALFEFDVFSIYGTVH